MSNYKDIEVANEILALMFSKYFFDDNMTKQLLEDKKLVTKGDEKTIEKIFNEYSKELKNESEE